MSAKSADHYTRGVVLLVDKPSGLTSFDVVRRVRGIIKKKWGIKKIKVGHAGTLDPLASGLLIICTGNATKKINHYINDSKVYTGEGKLGFTTPSYDLETSEIPTHTPIPDSLQIIQGCANTFLGTTFQTPPLYSAIKISGNRAYKLARSGQEMQLKARQIEIFSFKILNYRPPYFSFEVHCSKGTYIRSLIHELGHKLGCGAYLSQLRRVKSGNFSITDAISFEHLENML